MKFTKTFEGHLKEHYKEVFVVDAKGDGHYLQMHVVDPMFSGKSRLERSRHIFKTLGEFMKVVHAISVWGHTSEEWQKKYGQIEHAEYIHIA